MAADTEISYTVAILDIFLKIRVMRALAKGKEIY
jgi:hypothetical protein